MSEEDRSVPLSWIEYQPGSYFELVLGRDFRSRSKAPGPGPHLWTVVRSVRWLWKGDSFQGVEAEVLGTRKIAKVFDLALCKNAGSRSYHLPFGRENWR